LGAGLGRDSRCGPAGFDDFTLRWRHASVRSLCAGSPGRGAGLGDLPLRCGRPPPGAPAQRSQQIAD
jgi:hypothetical protein